MNVGVGGRARGPLVWSLWPSGFWWAAAATLFVSIPAAAQTISGRAADSSGAPIAHVRVLAYPVGDSAETATRIAFTNARGDFTLLLAERRPYVVRVRRIGFVAEPDRIVDLTAEPVATLAITLRGIAVALAPVRITGRAPRSRCLTLDDTTQNPRVRDWLDQALFALHTRRVVEREFVYKVQITQTRTPFQPREDMSLPYSYTHQPGAKSDQWMEDDGANLAMILRDVARSRAGDFMPTETTLLSPTFRTSYCFESVLASDADGTWLLHMRELHPPAGQPLISGTLTFAADGESIEVADFVATNGSSPVSTAHLGFTRVSIDGETFPILNARGSVHLPGKNDRGESGVAQAFVYSAFARAQ
jgi:hypothetical protein